MVTVLPLQSPADGTGTSSGRILLLADSLALPRPPVPSEGSSAIRYERTYPYLLRARLREMETAASIPVEILVDAERARTMPKAEQYWNAEGNLYGPALVMIHVGIVDCAPRVFSPREQLLVSKIRPQRLRQAILDFVNRHRRSIIQACPNKVYTSIPRFAEAAAHIAQDCTRAGIAVAFVSIAPPTRRLAYRSPGIEKKVRDYNQVLQDVAHKWQATYVDLYSALLSPSPDEFLLGDGHHLDVRGHGVLADLLDAWIRPVITQKATAFQVNRGEHA